MESQKLELLNLKFRADDLINKPLDSQVCIKLYCTSHGHQYLVGETESISSKIDLQFNQAIRLENNPALHQLLKIVCCDTGVLAGTELGYAEVPLEKLINTSQESKPSMTLDLTCPEDSLIVGTVHIEGAPVVDEKSTFTIGMSCLNVKDVELFGKSDPFLVLSRPNDSFITAIDKTKIPEAAWQILYTTEWKKNDLNPKFAPISISSWYLTRGNPDAILKIDIMHHNNIRKHKKIGTCYTSVRKISNESDRYVNAFCKKEKFAGTLHFYSFQEKKNISIKEYAEKGIMFRTLLAVDCTRSMLNPSGNMLQAAANEFLVVGKSSSEDSVLKSPRNEPSEMQTETETPETPKELLTATTKETSFSDISTISKSDAAIEPLRPVNPVTVEIECLTKPVEDLVEILIKHECQNRCGFYGYGARIGGSRFPVFAVNQNERHPAVKSKSEAIEQLKKLGTHLVPEEPTRISPVIQKALIMCKHQDRLKANKVYTLLVILTDGEISDTQDTVDSIVEASSFPISIVFVALKGASYDSLDYLTSGQEKSDLKKATAKSANEPQKNEPKKNLSRLTDSKGKMGVRKITTLVNYSSHKDNLSDLEDAVLKAIPLQMMQHFNLSKEIQERRNLLTVSMSEDKLGSDMSGRNSPGLPSPSIKNPDSPREQSAEPATKSEQSPS